MKRELDPFESKLKEKLQGKAAFPEDILWKRLNDELIRSDQAMLSKKRYWILGSALLVLLSLGTGYFIGSNQRPEIPFATQQLSQNLTGTKGSSSTVVTSELDHNKAKSTVLGKIIPEQTEQIITNTRSTQNDHRKSIPTAHMHSEQGNVNQLSRSDKVPTITHTKIPQLTLETTQPISRVESSLLSTPLNTTNLIQSNLLLDRMNIQKVDQIAHSQQEFIHRLHRKQFPLLLSASLALEPNATNRVLSSRVYGSASPFASSEKGKIAANFHLGFQAQLGRHLEIGTGIGSSHYITEELVQNKLVHVDPFHHHMNFESSISSFQIHEDHLHDDPEDQEEHELNFEDSTQFHLNYQMTNTIKSIQIPVTLGFVFHLNKCKVTMKTGLLYQHITQASQVVNISGFDAIRNDIQSQLVANSYYQLFQIGTEFPVSNHFSILFAPKYSYALKSISKSTVLRPNSLGLECALKYYF